VLRLFSNICQREGAPFYRVRKEFQYVQNGERSFDYEGLHRKFWGVSLNLAGPHQIINAATALGAMEVLNDSGYPVSNDAMIEGLKEVEWPGRLELICSSPRVVLDGAHNPAGALVLKESLEKEFQYRHLVLLTGMMKDKDFKSVLHLLAPLADHLILTQPHTDRAAHPTLLKKALKQNGKKAEIVEDFKEAIEKGLSVTEAEDLLCITGSLYTVGEARAYFLPGERS
jgi:dihydrofolate synthase/folylpolyglutamate synthase